MGYRGIEPPIGFLDPNELLPHPLPKGAPLCVALSGGADSVALLAMLADRDGLCAVHVHHGIRGEEADRDADFCKQLTEQMGVPLTILRIDAPALAEARGVSLETAARDGRYEAIEAHLRQNGISVLATAHHADDQLETVLQHLLRGSGLSGLCGIPACRPLSDAARVVRPLLSVTREALRDYLAACYLPFVEDGTNGEPCCTRNRLRLSVIPLLKELYPAAAQSAARCTEILTQDEEYLQSRVADFWAQEREAQYGVALKGDPHFRARVSPRANALTSLPEPIFARVLRQMLPVCPEKHHIDLIRDFCRQSTPGAALSLPGCTLTIEGGRLVLLQEREQAASYELVLHEGEQEIPGVGTAILTRGECAPDVPSPARYRYTARISLRTDTVKGQLVLRNRRTGDKLYQGRMHKTVRRLSGLCALPVRVRERMPLLLDAQGLLAVPFGRPGGATLYRDGTDPKDAGDTTLYLFFN